MKTELKPEPKALSPKLAEAVQKIRALQNFEKQTGMKATRSISEVMRRLTADELATDVTGEICTRWNERESTWRKSWPCRSRGTNQNRS
jgi:hypothetical protein